MNRFTTLLCTLAVALGVFTAGCSRDEQAAGTMTPDSTAADTTGALSFTGDFRGPLGVQLWSFRESFETDVRGTLQRVKDLGFEEVELAGTYGMSPAAFKALLDSVGLRATSMHADFGRLKDSTDVALNEAKALGVEWVGIAWAKGEGEFDEAYARQVAADFNRIGKAASAQGLKFFYHIHGFEFKPSANGTVPFDVLMKETDPANVSYQMDVFWATRPGQNPVELMQKYPNRWKLMHIKDMREGVPQNDHSGGAPAGSETAVGQGVLDFPNILKAAKAAGVERYYIEDEMETPFNTVPESISYLKSVRFAG